MVWVIEGNIKGSDKDEEGYPSISSHYLRPSRAYKLGRLSYSSTDSNGKTLKSKPHLLDFQLKTNAVPKDGAWTITTGDWTEANAVSHLGFGGVVGGAEVGATDSPNSATNLDPYSLTITATKALARRKVGQDDSQKEELDANIPHELRDGDVVRFLKEGQFSVRWVPMILCIPLASVSQKELYLRQAVQLGSLHSISSQKNSLTDVPQIGIKLAYRKFLSHHTHLLTKTLKANYNLFYASMLLRPICSPDYLSQLSIYVALPVRPANFPQIPENGVIDAKLEKTILELDPSVNPGFDVKRYWQHSVLENDWKKLPRTDSEGMTPASDSARPELDIEKWKPDERRKTLFKGILVVSFRKDSVEEHIIQLGGGYIYSCDLLQPEVQTWTLTAALEEFKSDNNVPDNIRIIIFPPNLEGDEGKLKQPLRAFADAIGVGSYTDDEAFLRAIAEVNPNVLDSGMSVEETQEASSALPFISSLLLPPSPDSPQSEPQDQLLVPPTAVQPTSSAPQAPASSFREIPGTHPEEGRVPARNRALRNSVQGGAEAGPSGEGQKSLPLPAAAEEEVVGPVRKLTRRIRSTKPAASASVDPFAFSSAADSRQPHTQVDAPELRAESTQATEVDDDISFIAPVRKLKRRGGPSQSEGSSSIFDIPSSYNTESPAKKSRTSTIAEEEEDSPASTLASNKGGATQLSAVDEELESTPVAGSSTSNPRKRGASEAVGSGDEDASRATALPARKTRRSTSEAPEEPVVVPARGKKVAPTPVKGKKGATTKKGAKDKDKDKPVEDEGLLRMKTVKRKGAEIDQGFNDDFNALKIVKPTLQPMKTQKGRRLAWNENDADEDLDRLIREDQEREENGDEWDGEGEGAGRGMFLVELVC
ncbi:hypothetical protein P7C70_g6657, partial [Phenoliferia sp. Uapishka_3]